jgi:hypothetical protein
MLFCITWIMGGVNSPTHIVLPCGKAATTKRNTTDVAACLLHLYPKTTFVIMKLGTSPIPKHHKYVSAKSLQLPDHTKLNTHQGIA